MIKHTFFMGLSTFLRLLTNVVLFIFLARSWTVETFGLFVYSFSLSSVFVLFVDYGFSQKILRDIGAGPDQIKRIVSNAFVAKLFSAALLIAVGGTFFVFSAENKTLGLVLVLTFAAILNSFAEFFNVAFRGLGVFHKETFVVSVANALHFGLIILLVIQGGGIWVISFGFVVASAFYLYLSWRGFRNYVGPLGDVSEGISALPRTLKEAFPFCADAGLTKFYGQVDTILVGYFLGNIGVGLYQAGIRLLQGCSTFALVLSNVFLPRIANQSDQPEQLGRLTALLFTQMMALGGAGSIVFLYGGEWVPNQIYGDKFSALSTLFPYLGVLLVARYFVAIYGVILTAVGLQTMRVYSMLVAIIVLSLSSYIFIPSYGVVGMIFSALAATASLGMMYVYKLLGSKYHLGFSRLNISICIVIGIFCVVAF